MCTYIKRIVNMAYPAHDQVLEFFALIGTGMQHVYRIARENSLRRREHGLGVNACHKYPLDLRTVIHQQTRDITCRDTHTVQQCLYLCSCTLVRRVEIHKGCIREG